MSTITDLVEHITYKTGEPEEVAMLIIAWITLTAAHDPRVVAAYAANDKTRFCEAPAVQKAVRDTAVAIYLKEHERTNDE